MSFLYTNTDYLKNQEVVGQRKMGLTSKIILAVVGAVALVEAGYRVLPKSEEDEKREVYKTFLEQEGLFNTLENRARLAIGMGITGKETTQELFDRFAEYQKNMANPESQMIIEREAERQLYGR